MLKACCDCIFGSPTSESDNNHDNINLNRVKHNSSGLTEKWSSKNMFSIPRNLNPGDSVSISGTVTTNPNSLSIILIAENNQNSDDHWQLVADFTENNVSVVENGTSNVLERIPANDLLTYRINDADIVTFKLKLKNVDDTYLHITSNDNYFLAEIEKSLYDIGSLAIGGDVEHVDKVLYHYESPIDGILPITRIFNSDTENVINLSGTLVTTPNSLSIGLATGLNQIIVCQVDANFNENQLNIKPVENGASARIDPSVLIADSKLSLSFVFDKSNLGENYITIKCKNLYIDQVTLNQSVDDIRHIIINGDKCITTLEFQFDT